MRTRDQCEGTDENADEDATRSALEKADRLACESMVLPALGCGVAGFDLADGGEIIREAIREYDPDSLEDVRFIAHGDEEYETLLEVASR